MASYNRVILIGNLTRDPELRFTQGGVPVCDIGLAVNRRKGDGEEEVHFFDITAWRGLGETVANWKKKGDPIHVEGRLQYRQWEAQDGSKRSKVDVVADDIQFLGRNGNGPSEGGSGGGGGARRDQREEVDATENDFEDIPFSHVSHKMLNVLSIL